MLYDPQWQVSETAGMLMAARRLIEDKENWCGRGWGRDGRMCVLHALSMVSSSTGYGYNDVHQGAYRALDVICGDAGGVGDFNDSHSHAEVLALIDRAIEMERAKGGI